MMRAWHTRDTCPSPDNYVCQECGLYKGLNHPFQGMVGNDNPQILAVAEAP